MNENNVRVDSLDHEVTRTVDNCKQLLKGLNVGSIDFGYVGEAPPIFAQAVGVRETNAEAWVVAERLFTQSTGPKSPLPLLPGGS